MGSTLFLKYLDWGPDISEIIIIYGPGGPNGVIYRSDSTLALYPGPSQLFNEAGPEYEALQ